jgi:acetoin utilization deacetylase AcuC-like enzyme
MSHPTMATGLVDDNRYLQHNPGLDHMWTEQGTQPYPFVDPIIHPSNHRLVMRTRQLIELSGLTPHLTRIEPRPATVEEIGWYHTAEYVARVQELSRLGAGDAGEGAKVGPGSYEIALLAAGGAIAAVDAVVEGRVRHAFANIRPPGHHAVADKGMGYCLFNNVVIAARHAQKVHGIERVTVVDWDVHDGNGTQEAFYADPSVLFVSLHQDRLYPPTMGLLEQTGTAEGAGSTVNLPLPAGSGDAVYRAAFERIVLPVIREFGPSLILVSAGQDASTMDPDGRMCLSTEAYRWMTRALMEAAADLCEGRLVILQEGGYSETYAPYCTLGILESLTGIASNLTEPQPVAWLQRRPDIAEVGPSYVEALDRIQQTHAANWSTLRR